MKFLNFNKEAPESGYWDQHLLSKIIKEANIQEKEGYEIVVIPAGKNLDKIEEINKYISTLEGVLLILTSNEDDFFDTSKLIHNNMKVWLMTPQAGKEHPQVDRFVEEGYTPHTELITEHPKRTLKWFFSGQNTHSRRRDMIGILRTRSDGELIESKGFTLGLSQEEYIKKMASAKIIPSAGGSMTPDTFRTFEALELGCIPLVDKYSATNKKDGYWQMIYGEDIQFPLIEDWESQVGHIDYFYDTFPTNSNLIFAWWQRRKRQIMCNLVDDYNFISKQQLNRDGITVVIPTSPNMFNPDTGITEETISTVRKHLPDAEIFLTFDGVREEQKDLNEAYQEYISRMLWKCNKTYKNVVPFVFSEHSHQVKMFKGVIGQIRTDKILYVEHDTPITPDCEIPFKEMGKVIDSGEADLIRLHFEAFIPEPHRYMMIDQEPRILEGIPLIRTYQWSQRPHLASKKFYERILADHFSPDAITFIEDKMHGVCINAWDSQQLQGWNMFKLWIYHPMNGNIKRSYHLNARGSEIKYNMKF
jgi:hypothetical protein